MPNQSFDCWANSQTMESRPKTIQNKAKCKEYSGSWRNDMNFYIMLSAVYILRALILLISHLNFVAFPTNLTFSTTIIDFLGFGNITLKNYPFLLCIDHELLTDDISLQIKYSCFVTLHCDWVIAPVALLHTPPSTVLSLHPPQPSRRNRSLILLFF